MKYADRVSEMMNAFSPAPLKIEQMQEFYCSDTMEYRVGDKYSSPMEDIYDMCREVEEGCAFLLLGHRGCGKSTELNRLSEKFLADGYQVKTVSYSKDLDLMHC